MVEFVLARIENSVYQDFLLVPEYFLAYKNHYQMINFSPADRVLRGSAVKCLTRNPGVLGSTALDPLAFFVGVSLGKTLQSTGETQESMNNVCCHRDMTEILLTHSHTMTPFDAPGKQAF